MKKPTKSMAQNTKRPQRDLYEELRADIARRYPGFSDRLQVIAEFALDHPTDMALGTVAEVAERAKVQPSAIVRFAHAIGYGGFTEMQQIFRSRLVAGAAPSYKERIAGLRRDGRFRSDNSPHDLLSRFASEGAVSLESAQEYVREADLTRAIGIMGAAQTIYVVGLGGSFPVAAHLTYVLRRMGRRVVLLDGLGSALGDHVLTATPQDAVIAISFRPYNRDTVQLFPRFSRAWRARHCGHRQPAQPDRRRRRGGVRNPRHAGSGAAHDGGADVPRPKSRRRADAGGGLGLTAPANQSAVQPPSTTIDDPVISDDASEARNTMAPVRSPTWPTRPSLILLST